MKTILSVSFVLAAADQVTAPQAQAPQAPDVTMGQAQLANQMGAYYRSIYAPGVPATAGAAPAQPAGGMGAFGSYGAMGPQVGQAYDGAFGGTPAQVQASQSQMANQLGAMYRQAYVTPQMEQQIQAQQAAQAAQQAQQAKAAEKAPKASKASEATLLAAAPTEAPKSAAPAIPQNADACKTMAELDAWHKARSDTIKKYVPKGYQTYAMKSIESDYEAAKKKMEDAKKAPSEPVKGPLFLLEDKEDSGDDMLAKFKKEVGVVEKKADSWVDEASQSMKSAFDKAAEAVEGKADKAASKADDVEKVVKDKVKDIHNKMKHGDKDEAEMLREKGVSPVFLLAPCLALGAAAGVYLRRRASDDELVSVYHMQV